MSLPAVVFGGPSPEHDISVSTGLQATHVLGDCHAVYWDKTGRFHLVDPASEVVEFAEGIPRKSQALELVASPGAGFVRRKKPLDIDVILNCCHGGPGEDGTLQGVFDLVGYRYTGPGQWGSALGMDKLTFGAAVTSAGLAALPRLLLTDRVQAPFDPPYIIKPRFGGSSIGIEVVADLDSARHLVSVSPHHEDGTVIEPYVEGCRDLQVAIRTFPEFESSAIEEPMRTEGGLYSYTQKYLAWGEGSGIARNLPADLPPSLEERLRDWARRVAELVGLRSVARIDFLNLGDELWVNEVNTIPGSLGSYLWVELTRAELIEGILEEARRSDARRFSTAGADGSALRNAGTVASKLG